MKSKDLIGIPWMVAFALRADGWYLRQWCPWVKRNGMPESAADRPGTSCETVFLLAKQPDYYFDMEAVRRPNSSAFSRDAVRLAGGAGGPRPLGDNFSKKNRSETGERTPSTRAERAALLNPGGRNLRSGDVWFDSVGLLMAADGTTPLGLDVPPKGRKDAHFAVMPEALVRPLIRAGSSEKGVCPDCSAPWERVVERDRVATRPGRDTKVTGDALTDGNRDPERHVTFTRTVGWRPTCAHAAAPVPAVVLDPFAGSGTVPAVARQLGRAALGADLNPDYAAMARRRVGAVDPPLF